MDGYRTLRREDDPGLLGAEMWANRTIAAAADARKYGVNGLLGIHWRTFETSLTLQALARVAWEPGLTVEQLYNDFATKAFGAAVGKQAVSKNGLFEPFVH
jgi:hypothetical protein